MGKIVKIENEAIKNSLENTTRQYFAGNLSKPQEIEFVRDERLEIGISSYSDYKYEPAHVHSLATEYQYMISGWTEYMDVETGEISEFRKGDFAASWESPCGCMWVVSARTGGARPPVGWPTDPALYGLARKAGRNTPFYRHV